jgi:quinoprotein glucose dehydrogenase
MSTKATVIILCLSILAGVPVLVLGQNDWMFYGQDPGGTKFSTLKQINTENVSKLQRAWTFHTGDEEGFFSSTPLVIDNAMYFNSTSGVFALEADTGRQMWKYEARSPARRGVSYWPGDGKIGPRILTNVGTKMLALDARTGTPASGFGDRGSVEMNTSWGSPPAIYKNYAITGGGLPLIRAWDLRTGNLVWSFNLIAQPGDPGHESWEDDSWKNPGGTNVWGFLSVDVENGLVFAPVSQAGFDYYGGERGGDNLYGDCVVAIDANTGKLKWYQQTVHHDIWDFDLGAQPSLIQILQDGRRIPAVAQHTKMGLLFIYNRLTGEPIFGVEERPVPQSEARGEKTSPTQPFPMKPPPLARMSMTKDELYSLTPEHASFCKDLWEKNNVFNEGPYTPWVTKDSGRTTLVFPGAIGGGNWGGVSFDPDLGLIFANVGNNGQWGYLEKNEPDARYAYRKTTPFGQGNPARFRFWNPETTWPCQQPPWGELFAIHANTGEIAWRIPLGSFPDLEARGVKNAGTPNLGGSIATAGGLVFIAATVDSKFRAFDSKTGRELWSATIDAPGHSVPSTYVGRNGKQYVVIPAGGGGFLQGPTADAIIAFALP